MWIQAPEVTQEQRDKGNQMAAKILMRVRCAERERERERIKALIPTDELSEEELRAYVHSIID